MSIKNDVELANTQAKLDYLEARYESRRHQPSDDPKLREASLRSLKCTINQFIEEIVRYKAHQPSIGNSMDPKASNESGDTADNQPSVVVRPAKS